MAHSYHPQITVSGYSPSWWTSQGGKNLQHPVTSRLQPRIERNGCIWWLASVQHDFSILITPGPLPREWCRSQRAESSTLTEKMKIIPQPSPFR